jgi:hypothetical protein
VHLRLNVIIDNVISQRVLSLLFGFRQVKLDWEMENGEFNLVKAQVRLGYVR